MNKILNRLFLGASLALLAPAASASILFSDNFQVSSNSQNLNQQLATRQSGPLVPGYYTGWQGQHQVGNTTTDIGQPGGATNSNYVLLAGDGCFLSDLPLDTAASGPLTIEFDMYMTGTSNPNTDTSTWGAVTLQNVGVVWPIVGSGQFGFIARVNGGIHMWDGNGDGITGGWDTPGFATSTHWKLTISDSNGTGPAFNGNGSQVTFVNGTTTLGTVSIAQLNSQGLRLGFRNIGNRYVGVANLVISGSQGSLQSPGQNLSFEYDTILNGNSINMVPAGWTAFNVRGPDRVGSQRPAGSDYSLFDPLAATATGTNFCWMNRFNGDGFGGIYQDFGALQSNTVYTLTVALGSRQDRFNSPGILQLVSGTDNTGTVLATGGGLPDLQDSWQDFTVSYTNGPATNGHLIVVLGVNGANSIQANFDNVRLTTAPYTAPIPPSIVTDLHPLSQRVATGSALSLTVTVNGSLPLRYQWYDLNGPITGATNTTFNFNAVTGTSGYYAVITNLAGGVTSAVAQVVAATNIVTVRNFSFEDGTQTGSGGKTIPVQWSDFSNNNFSAVDGANFSVVNPLAPPADGNNFFAINEGPADPTGGIYQDVGALQPNTIYTLTVAIGRRADVSPGTGDWSPGILSLRNGTDNTGTLLATVTGHPDNQDSWQDYSVSFTNVSTTGHLTVTLAVAGSGTFQGLFDNVRVTTAPAPAVVPPSLVTDLGPLNQRVTTGAALAFNVNVTGSAPLGYQWYNQSGALTGANAATYNFAALTGTNSYYVIVTNLGGAVTTSVAQVMAAPGIVTVRNFSFEDGVHTGTGGQTIPVQWSDFLNNNYSTVANNSFSVVNPLAAPADGNDFFAINEGPGDPTGGIYQDVGTLQPNTVYTSTVAVGRRPDGGPGTGDWSPGILTLVNGTDNTGPVLATVTGHPDNQDSWQDYSVSFTNANTSGHLTVTLSVAGAGTFQGLFDNVRLVKAAAPAAPVFNPVRVVGGNLVLSGSGGTANGSYSVLTATNLTAPVVWTTAATGAFDGSGAFTNSLPVGAEAARFYRLSVP